MDIENNQHPFPLLAKLPSELRLTILTHTYLLQMQDAYQTCELEEMAGRVCAFGQSVDKIHPWIVALVDVGVRIPPTGWTVFHVAARAGDIPLIRRLVRLGYDINCLSKSRTTATLDMIPIHGAHRDLTALQALCEEGANINFVDDRESHVLSLLISYCQDIDVTVAAVKLLLQYGASTKRALHAAAKCDMNAPLVPILVEAGADLEELRANRTPLILAVSLMNVQVAHALLDAGAHVNGAGGNALFAIFENYSTISWDESRFTQMVKVLCEAGANLNQLGPDNNNNNNTVLSFFLTQLGTNPQTWSTAPAVVNVLCRAGANVRFPHHGIPSVSDIGVEGGDTPLHFVFAGRHLIQASRKCAPDTLLVVDGFRAECVQTLITYGADVNAVNDMGRTPLHSAVMHGSPECVKILLGHGGRLDVKDALGDTVIAWAEKMRQLYKGETFPSTIYSILKNGQKK